MLDECVPYKVKNFLPQHECQTVPETGLAGRKNGELLSAAERLGFEVLLTVDKGVQYEQNMRDRNIAILIFRAKSNRLKDLVPLIPACLAHLESIQRGEVVKVGQ